MIGPASIPGILEVTVRRVPILANQFATDAERQTGRDSTLRACSSTRSMTKGPMIAKYNVEYTVPFQRHNQTSHYLSDDPVACEAFLVELLERGYHIRSIKHDGVDLPRNDFDKLLKTAASMLASKRLCGSLGIKADEERYRFGFTA